MKRFEIEKSNYENRDIMCLPKSITSKLFFFCLITVRSNYVSFIISTLPSLMFSDVAKSYPLPVQKAVSNFMLKPVNTVDGTTASLSSSEAYIPWRSSK